MQAKDNALSKIIAGSSHVALSFLFSIHIRISYFIYENNTNALSRHSQHNNNNNIFISRG